MSGIGPKLNNSPDTQSTKGRVYLVTYNIASINRSFYAKDRCVFLRYFFLNVSSRYFALQSEPELTVCAADQVHWVRGIDEFNRDAAAWKEFLDHVPDASVFDTQMWISAMLCPDGHRETRIGIIRQNSRILAALPLTIGWEVLNGVPLRTARIVGYPLTDRFVPLVDSAHPQLFLSLLDAASALRIDALCLTEVLDGPSSSGVVRDWIARRGATCLSRLASEARVASIDETDSEELEKSYSSKHRTNVKRSRRRLQELGALSFETLRPRSEDIAAVITRLKEIEDQAWQGQNGTGLFSTPSRLRAFSRAFDALADEQAFIAHVMKIDGQDVMYVLGLVHGGTFYWYSTAYLADRIKGSAFAVLNHDLMLNLARMGIAQLDSSRNTPGAENALDRLEHEFLRHRHFMIFRRSPLALLHVQLMLRAKPLYYSVRARLCRRKKAASNQWSYDPPIGSTCLREDLP